MLPFPSAEKESHPFSTGIQAGLSIAIGYLPIAFTYGLLAKSSGLSLVETVGMSVIVFAGASQYIALSMIGAGTGAFEIIITAFIMNIRHLLMSASLNERMKDDAKWIKAFYGFLITDETFSVAATRTEKKLTSAFMLGLGLIAYGSWVVNSGIGYLIGAGLPATIQNGMAVALYAMFIGLLIPSAKKSRKVIALAGTAALLNSLFSLYEPLAGGWGIILSTLISSVGIEFFVKEEKVHGK